MDMKRILCLLMTLLLLAGIALADDVFGFSMKDYYGCAGSFLPRLGYAIEWGDASEDMGVTCLQLTYTGMSSEHGVFVMGDPVTSLNIISVFLVTGDDDELEKNISEFSQITKSAVTCAWVAEHAADEELSQQLPIMLEAVEAEFTALIDPMLNVDEAFNGSAVKQGTLFGFPAIFELELDTTTYQCILSIRVMPKADVSI